MQGEFLTLRSLKRARGRRHVEVIPNPAAGVDWEWTPRAGYLNVPIGIHAELHTNAEAGERFATLQLVDGDGHVLLESPPEAAAVAGETLAITWHKQIAFPVKSTNHKLGLWLPDETLTNGYHMRVVTTGIKATDQWENIRVWTKEYSEDQSYEHELHEALHKLIHGHGE